MSRRPYSGVSTRQTPQSRPILGSSQVENSAGGFSWQVDKWTRLHRFLILGSEGGTYYIKEQKLTEENAQALVECVAENGKRVVADLLDISVQGRAPKQDPTLFALAYCIAHGDLETRRYVADLLPEIARTGTMLFTFVEYALQFRGWGPVLRRAVSNWYLTHQNLEYQLIKYRQRGGFTHKRLLNVAHPNPENCLDNGHTATLLRWAHGDMGSTYEGDLPFLIEGYEKLKNWPADDGHRAAKVIRSYKLPWEAVPTELLNSPDVWYALLEKMPVMATIRQLPKLTSVGVLSPADWGTVEMVVERLKGVKGAKVHPLQILFAMKTYASGKGFRGKLTWNPVQQIVDALDEAFYLAFDNVEPTGKTIVLGLDVSGSMSGYNSKISGTNITAREASCAMAMVTARVEPRCVTVAFSHQLEQFHITPKATLKGMMEETSRIPFGRTDCALPMLEANRQKVPVDCFQVYTDSETWAGKIHPAQALRAHREHFNPNAKSIVVGMTSNGFSIADPNDPGMLDVVGFDTAVPAVMADFIRS